MSVMSTVSSAVSTVKSVVGAVTGLVGTANGIISKASSLADASIESVISSLPISSGSFSKITDALTTVGSISSIVSGGTSQALSKVKQLLGGAGEALSNPISFVTKTLKDTVDGFSSSKDLGSTISDVLNINPKSLSATASRAGLSSISTVSELNDALVNITDAVYSGAYTATNIVSATYDTASTVTDGLSKLISEGIQSNLSLADNIRSGINYSVSQTVAAATDSVSLLQTGNTNVTKNIINTAVSTLPSTIKDTVGYLDTTLINTQKTQVSNRLTESINALSNEIDYISTTKDSYNKILAKTTVNYPRFIDSAGNEVSTIVNDTSQLSQSQIKKLLKTIQKVCPDIKIPSVTNFDEMKALYDVTLDIICKNGMVDALTIMLTYTTYFDTRSIYVLKSHLNEIKKTGNLNLYKTIVLAIGPGNIATPEADLKILIANTILSDTKLAMIDELCILLQIPLSKLIAGNMYGDQISINTTNVTLLSATDTKLLDNTITPTVRNMALQMKIAYGK